MRATHSCQCVVPVHGTMARHRRNSLSHHAHPRGFPLAQRRPNCHAPNSARGSMRTTYRSILLLPAIAFTAGACADSPTESATSIAPPSLSVVGEPGFVLLKKVGPL